MTQYTVDVRTSTAVGTTEMTCTVAELPGLTLTVEKIPPALVSSVLTETISGFAKRPADDIELVYITPPPPMNALRALWFALRLLLGKTPRGNVRLSFPGTWMQDGKVTDFTREV